MRLAVDKLNWITTIITTVAIFDSLRGKHLKFPTCRMHTKSCMALHIVGGCQLVRVTTTPRYRRLFQLYWPVDLLCLSPGTEMFLSLGFMCLNSTVSLCWLRLILSCVVLCRGSQQWSNLSLHFVHVHCLQEVQKINWLKSGRSRLSRHVSSSKLLNDFNKIWHWNHTIKTVSTSIILFRSQYIHSNHDMFRL
jgi:hypothetical protein